MALEAIRFFFVTTLENLTPFDFGLMMLLNRMEKLALRPGRVIVTIDPVFHLRRIRGFVVLSGIDNDVVEDPVITQAKAFNAITFPL